VDLTNIIGLGIAGNFAGHLEQAGEAKDFASVTSAEAQQPKALFPCYVPSAESGFLSAFPFSNDTILMPKTGGNLQIEPEVAVYCAIEYQGSTVSKVSPICFGAYNDCSIRRPDANKISEKKNWGAQSKGIAADLIAIDQIAQGGVMDQYRIASFLKRDGQYYAYGVDSPVKGYSYFYEKLFDWIADRMNHQIDEGPMESIAMYLKHADYPPHALISIGATRYTEFGETKFLQAGDQSIVVVYDANVYAPDAIVSLLSQETLPTEKISILIQDVV